MGVTGPVSDNAFRGYAYVTDFAPDRGDTLWTSTLDGLHWYNPAHNTTGPLKQGTGSGFLDSRFLIRDRHGLIWGGCATTGYADSIRAAAIHAFSEPRPQCTLSHRSATTCTEGPDGDLWFSYGSEEKYLVRWRRSTGVFEK